MLDYIYGREEGWPVPPETSDVGRQVFEFTTQSNACEGVRARRGFVADVLDQLVEETARPHVLSIASGHLSRSLAFLGRQTPQAGPVGRLRRRSGEPQGSGTLLWPPAGRAGAGLGAENPGAADRSGRFDLVYSTGLFDYMPLTTGQRLTSIMFQMLRPRGRVLVANFLPGILDVGYMESYMGWKLIYRTRQEMLKLSLDIPQAEIRNIKIFAEENQNIIFLEITKR